MAQDQVAPFVKKMDEQHKFEPSVVQAMFENGFMGIEIDTELGGSGCNFLTTILTVEELSKVDPAVAAFVDIHNTLVNSLIIKVASEEQKKKYLPKLAQEYVSLSLGLPMFVYHYYNNFYCSPAVLL